MKLVIRTCKFADAPLSVCLPTRIPPPAPPPHTHTHSSLFLFLFLSVSPFLSLPVPPSLSPSLSPSSLPLSLWYTFDLAGTAGTLRSGLYISVNRRVYVHVHVSFPCVTPCKIYICLSQIHSRHVFKKNKTCLARWIGAIVSVHAARLCCCVPHSVRAKLSQMHSKRAMSFSVLINTHSNALKMLLSAISVRF